MKTRNISATWLVQVCLIASMLAFSSVAFAADAGKSVTKSASSTAPVRVAKATTTVIKTDASAPAEKQVPLSASLLVATSFGLGGFVSGPTQQVAFATSFVPTLSYKLDAKQSVSASIGGTVYHINDYGTAFYNGRFILGDASFTYGHGSLFKDESSGFNLSGALRVYLPTSLSSRYQNRIFSMRPSLTGSISAGPVRFSLTSMFAKYFNTSTSPSLNCDGDFAEGNCREGRPDGPGVAGGFESEIRSGEIFLPSAGLNSFYVGNSFNMAWTITDSLSLSAGATVYNIFGYRSFELDELSSHNAKAGRNQLDRLITSVELGYQISKKLSVGLSFATDTVRPFGADGNDLVIFDLERASSNISSIGLSLSGTL